MSSQRVIQDSDDENDEVLSEVASSCDPLQDSSYAPLETGLTERVEGHQTALQVPAQARAQSQFSASELPQVDFDKFLRSESSIMAGDYEDERWVSTANSNPGNVIPFGNFHAEKMQLQDNSFPYTVNVAHGAPGSIPPTANEDHNKTVVADELDHPSKRRKVSNTNTQDTLLKEPQGTGSSYNFFASPDPNGLPQTSISLPSVPLSEGDNGLPQNIETEPLPMGTPPPTVPFSEDPLPVEDEKIVIETTTAEYEVQETMIEQLLSDKDNEFLSTKKKRGRPKKQDISEASESEPKIVAEPVSEVTEQQPTKKKPGRPKKQETDTPSEQLQVADPSKDQEFTNLTNTAATTTSKTLKKKVKRSKTTSDIPSNKSEDLKGEQDVVWIETSPIDTVAPTEEKTNTEPPAPNEEIKVPKKRGRKKKEVVEEPVVAVHTENQKILQDISNIQQHAPKQEKHQGIDVEIEHTRDIGGTLKAANIPETPTVEITINPTNPTEGEGGAATPTPQEKNKTVKQTPVSSAGKVPFRVGLSRRARIAPLLKVVRK